MIDKQRLNRSFSRQAKEYDRFANVQKRMAERLMRELPEEKDVHRVLEVGCGTGYLTERLLARYPDASIIAVDIADGMIEHVKQRFAANREIEFICADIEEYVPIGRFDLIVSNAAFQWLNEPARTMSRLVSSLSAGGAIHFTTLGSRTFHELQASCRIAAEELGIYSQADDAGPGFPELADWKSYCDMKAIQSVLAAEEMIEYFSSSRDFLRALKKIGASTNKGNASMGPALMKRVLSIYDATFSSEHGIGATYEVFYAKCKKEIKQSVLT